MRMVLFLIIIAVSVFFVACVVAAINEAEHEEHVEELLDEVASLLPHKPF